MFINIKHQKANPIDNVEITVKFLGPPDDASFLQLQQLLSFL